MSGFIPVVDLFAGPGGLSEGFSQFGLEDWGQLLSPLRVGEEESVRPPLRFEVVLSVEMDRIAHQTLELRALVRKLKARGQSEHYYEFLTGRRSREELFDTARQTGVQARAEAWCATLGQIDEKEVDRRITAALGGQEAWVLIGGPPCQAYSLVGRSRNRGIAGYRPELDKRHFLYQEYLRIVARHQPPVFVMENVKGLLSARVGGESMFDRISEDLSRPDLAAFGRDQGLQYVLFPLSVAPEPPERNSQPSFLEVTHDYVVRMENHGIPQARHRVILLGVRRDVKRVPTSLPSRIPVPLVKVIDDLPPLRSGLSDGTDSVANWRAAIAAARRAPWFDRVSSDIRVRIREVLSSLTCSPESRGVEIVRKSTRPSYAGRWSKPEGFRFILNHTTRGHMQTDLHRYLFASAWADQSGASPTLGDFPAALLPKHENARMSADDGGYFDDRFRVQVANRPSNTITSHISKDGHYYIHFSPEQCRSLTVREAARAQTFPDDYLFCGPRTEQYRQVGNAVPPLLATQAASVVSSLIS